MTTDTPVPVDEFHGIGGSYEIGPDGKRRLVARTDLTELAELAPAPTAPATSKNSSKE